MNSTNWRNHVPIQERTILWQQLLAMLNRFPTNSNEAQVVTLARNFEEKVWNRANSKEEYTKLMMAKIKKISEELAKQNTDKSNTIQRPPPPTGSTASIPSTLPSASLPSINLSNASVQPILLQAQAQAQAQQAQQVQQVQQVQQQQQQPQQLSHPSKLIPNTNVTPQPSQLQQQQPLSQPPSMPINPSLPPYLSYPYGVQLNRLNAHEPGFQALQARAALAHQQRQYLIQQHLLQNQLHPSSTPTTTTTTTTNPTNTATTTSSSSSLSSSSSSQPSLPVSISNHAVLAMMLQKQAANATNSTTYPTTTTTVPSAYPPSLNEATNLASMSTSNPTANVVPSSSSSSSSSIPMYNSTGSNLNNSALLMTYQPSPSPSISPTPPPPPSLMVPSSNLSSTSFPPTTAALTTSTSAPLNPSAFTSTQATTLNQARIVPNSTTTTSQMGGFTPLSTNTTTSMFPIHPAHPIPPPLPTSSSSSSSSSLPSSNVGSVPPLPKKTKQTKAAKLKPSTNVSVTPTTSVTPTPLPSHFLPPTATAATATTTNSSSSSPSIIASTPTGTPTTTTLINTHTNATATLVPNTFVQASPAFANVSTHPLPPPPTTSSAATASRMVSSTPNFSSSHSIPMATPTSNLPISSDPNTLHALTLPPLPVSTSASSVPPTTLPTQHPLSTTNNTTGSTAVPASKPSVSKIQYVEAPLAAEDVPKMSQKTQEAFEVYQELDKVLLKLANTPTVTEAMRKAAQQKREATYARLRKHLELLQRQMTLMTFDQLCHFITEMQKASLGISAMLRRYEPTPSGMAPTPVVPTTSNIGSPSPTSQPSLPSTSVSPALTSSNSTPTPIPSISPVPAPTAPPSTTTSSSSSSSSSLSPTLDSADTTTTPSSLKLIPRSSTLSNRLPKRLREQRETELLKLAQSKTSPLSSPPTTTISTSTTSTLRSPPPPPPESLSPITSSVSAPALDPTLSSLENLIRQYQHVLAHTDLHVPSSLLYECFGTSMDALTDRRLIHWLFIQDFPIVGKDIEVSTLETNERKYAEELEHTRKKLRLQLEQEELEQENEEMPYFTLTYA